MSRPEHAKALAASPAIPRDSDGPVFAEPWQAEAFALALALHERGIFAWTEWSERLGRQLREREAAGLEGGNDYYLAWLAALEELLAERRIVAADERLARAQAWQRAAEATPHGQPIVLGAERMSR